MLLNTILGISFVVFMTSTQAAYSSKGPNVMYYWGQNSAGGENTQDTLASYCQSGQADAIILSFLNVFNIGGLPEINLAGACPDATLLDCPAVRSDIKTCQSKGVKILLSLGGASGSYGIASDEQGQAFAQTIWDMFGGGNSSTRPFGDAVIDGVDLDIEGGSSTGYAAFVTSLRLKSPSLIIGAAPQCPFPDAILGPVIDSVSMDYVNVQFYNNYCSVSSGSSFNFETWDNWAKTIAPNKDIKVMLTVPGSSTAAGSGYVSISTLDPVLSSLASQYTSFGGVSVWDASQAWNKGDFPSELYGIVHGDASLPTAAAHTETLAASAIPTTTTDAATITPDQSCFTESQMACTSKGSYAICDHGLWVSAFCPSGTICIQATDSLSIYCGYASSFVSLLYQASFKLPKVSAQLFLASSYNGTFEAVIHAHRTTLSPFRKDTTIEFNAPGSIQFDQSSIGQIRQTGRLVRVKLENDESMALVVTVNGTFSKVFIAPPSLHFT